MRRDGLSTMLTLVMSHEPTKVSQAAAVRQGEVLGQGGMGVWKKREGSTNGQREGAPSRHEDQNQEGLIKHMSGGTRRGGKE